MRLKWYLCSLVLSFVLFGVVKHYHVQEHNQEIVLQFESGQSQLEHIEKSLNALKEQLKVIGGRDFQISANGNGLYRIAYYSNLDAVTIESELSSTGIIIETSNASKVPFSFEVFEIRPNFQKHWDFEGQLVTIVNPKSDRLSEIKLLKYFGILQNETSRLQLDASKAKLYDFQLHINFNAIVSPEIRAGPIM